MNPAPPVTSNLHGQTPRGEGGSTGSVTMNRVSPGCESTRRLPWCFSATIRQARSSPSPVPCPTGLVVKKGEDPIDDVFVDSRSVVADLDPDRVVGVAACSDGEGPGTVHRLNGVVDDVRPHPD